MFLRNRIIVLILATLFAVNAAPATSGEQALPEHFSAFAVSTGGPRTSGVATQVEFTITRWSTDVESQQFLQALQKGGHDALLDAFQDAKPVGTIQTPGALAYDLRYAQQEDLGDGIRRIVLATDRPMSFWETVNRPQSADYPFTFIELRVNARGEGEGKLAVASAIGASRNGKMMTVINYDTQLVQLNEVRKVAR
jgi:hypothetical protein